MKTKKHKDLISDYERQKSKQLEYIATRLLKDDEKNNKFKEKIMNINFLDNFKTNE